MSWIRRFTRLFAQRRLQREIDEELASHIEEAIEQGRSPEEARKAFGGALLQRERSRDVKLLPWLDSLASDVVFGWRQLNKHRTVSAAAILSLALAIGAATAAYQLVEAVLLRTLPVANPDRLFYLSTTYIDRDGREDPQDSFDYPSFRRYRDAVADRADLLIVGSISNRNLREGYNTEQEKPYWQYVSGNVFEVFGLQPSLGRLLTRNDDVIPESPIAVIGYAYWTRRFANDPNVIGKSILIGRQSLQIVGVAPKGFIGTEPGRVADVFVPASMHADAFDLPGWAWFRLWVRPKPGFSAEQVRLPLQASFQRQRQKEAKEFPSGTQAQYIRNLLNEEVRLLPAATGASDVKKTYRGPLLILAVLVALVLLIACANVASLLNAQATARAHEMALRVSIGAGRGRLIQLMLVESALLAMFASALGILFAGWCAPIVIAMLHMPEDPVRLVLDSGWRGLPFNFALAFAVTLLFGIAPALRASGVQPISALKGGAQPRSRRRFLRPMLAAQMAFCVFVQFIAGLFISTFERLNHRPLGFSSTNRLVMDASFTKEQPPRVWMQVADQIRQTPGVESVSMAGWPLLSRNSLRIPVALPGQAVDIAPPYVLDVSPGFFETMQIALVSGRDFRPGDVAPSRNEARQPLPGVGIVNETFVRTYFAGQNPLGRSVEWHAYGFTSSVEIVGVMRDAVYRDVREKLHPTIYVPLFDRQNNTFFVKAAGDPLALAPILRQAAAGARSDLRIGTIQPQSNFIRWQLIRERLLATLSLFFAIVALLLAGVGLYGTLNYSVTRQRREIGVRMTLGARSGQVVRRVMASHLAMVIVGLLIGLAGAAMCGRLVQSLLYEVKTTDPLSLIAPLAALCMVAILAVLPPALRAARIDPAETLRIE